MNFLLLVIPSSIPDCTESSLFMFMDGVDEFYKTFLDRINDTLKNEDRDKNVRYGQLTDIVQKLISRKTLTENNGHSGVGKIVYGNDG